VAALAAHEVAHLKEPRAVRLVRFSAVLVLLPLAVWRPLFARGGWPALGLALLFALLLVVLIRLVGRRMEERADTAGREGETDAGAYARALERLYRVNLVPAVVSRRGGVHPNLYDRMVAAGVQPDYERPRPPARLGPLVALVTLVVTLIAVAGPVAAARLDGTWWRVAVRGATANDLGLLGATEPDADRAIVCFAGAAALSPRDPTWPAHQAIRLARAGRAEAAAAALADAEARAARRPPGPWTDLVRVARESVEALRR